MGFLQGDFFAALTETFGRPEVFLLLTAGTDLRFEKDDAVVLDWRAEAGDAIVSALDPRTGHNIHLGADTCPDDVST